MDRPGLKASSVVRELESRGVTHVVTLPDSETGGMYRAIEASDALHMVPVCREGEAIAIAAGLWSAGKRPVVVIQSAGLFESGDALRGLGLGVNLPLVMFIGYRGYQRHGETPDSAARILEPFLHTWRVPFYLLEDGGDIGRIELAFRDAKDLEQPVAVLLGVEWADESGE